MNLSGELEFDELEFAVRSYQVATEHLMEVLEQREKIPATIAGALLLLSGAINTEWEIESFESD